MTGDDLKKWRMAMNLKQEELAIELGVSRPTLSAWENRGDGKVDRVVFLAIEALKAMPLLRMNYRDGIGPPEGAKNGDA